MALRFGSGSVKVSGRLLPCDPNAISDYILRNIQAAAAMSSQDKLEVVRVLLAAGERLQRTAAVDAANKCAVYQSAATALLQNTISDPAQCRLIIDGLGGAAAVTTLLAQFSPKLGLIARTMVVQMRDL